MTTCQPFSKVSKRRRSLKRHDAIARAAEGIGSGLVHHVGHPINQQTNAGFNRRCEVGHVGNNAGPEIGLGAGCENAWAT
jgi:hypothetical protein